VVSVLVLLASCVVLHDARSGEPSYPARPVRILVGFPPGGAVDLIPRLLAPRLNDAMGQPWIVDNRVGAAGNLVVEIAARATPDGHTVLVALDTQLTANPILHKLSFAKELQPVTLLASTDMMLIVNPGVPAKTFSELVELGKRKPGTLNFASAGIGSVVHLTAELLKKRTGMDLVHVPYNGGGPAATAVLSGEAQVLLGTVTSASQYVAQGRMRALANTAAKRSKWMPDLPTVAELGYPDIDAVIWYALFLPGATPKSIATRIRDEALKALQHADVQTAMDRQGLVTLTSTPEGLAARIRKETQTWAGIISEAGIRVH